MKKIIIFSAVFFICFSYKIFPQEITKPLIDKVTLFKNGTGFIRSHIKLPDEKTVVIGQLPVPTFGTFWVGYRSDVKLKNLVTSFDKKEKEISARSIEELLKANPGKKVIIYTSDSVIEGTVIKEEIDEDEMTPSPYYMSPSPQQNQYGGYIYPVGSVIKIKTEKGIVALNPGSIIRAEFPEADIITKTIDKQKFPSIRIELEKAAEGEDVTISYMAKGITWSPGYLIDLSDPKTARFNARAIVINELTDFENVSLQLVTGFPNIKFADVISPVSKTQSLSDFLNSLSGSGGYSSNYMTQQVMLSNVARYEMDAAPLVPGYSPVQEGFAAEDLFFYPVNNFSLKKDETAWVPLFTAEMPYKHIYTWNIGDFVDSDERYRSEMLLPDGKKAEEIWHSCRLTNTLNMPLTTASVEFISNGEFTGQDVCFYTAPKAKTTIRINKALNVLAEQTEVELERKRDAAVFHGYRYDLVKVKGELIIKNNSDKNINLEITKELSGQVLNTTPVSKDVKSAKGLKQVNEKHILTWEIELPSSKEQNVSYQYEVYIRQ